MIKLRRSQFRNITTIGCFLLFLLTASTSYAQEVHDVGVQGGISTYLGDFNNVNVFKSPSPYLGAHYRYNFDDYNGVRVSANVGQIRGSSDSYEHFLPGIPPVKEFSELFFDLDVKYEVNFRPFNPLTSRHEFFSPYLLVGIAAYYYNGNMLPAIPFGAGVKVAATRRITLGLEMQLSKTFNDELDFYKNVGNKSSFISNNDWFFTCGFVFSYRLNLGQKICPVYL